MVYLGYLLLSSIIIFSLICFTIPTSKVDTLCPRAALTSTYLQLWEVATDLASVCKISYLKPSKYIAVASILSFVIILINQFFTITKYSPSIGTSLFLTRSVLFPTMMTTLVFRSPDCQSFCMMSSASLKLSELVRLKTTRAQSQSDSSTSISSIMITQ